MVGVADISYILCDIEKRVIKLPDIHHIGFDKWLISSALQKAIRRGETKQAVTLAANLWQTDKNALWRRIGVIALEDIGIADISITTEALAICAASQWRRKVGDLKIALYMVEQMANAVKSRAITHIYMQAELNADFKTARENYAGLDVDSLTVIALKDKEDIINRAISLWYLAGGKLYPSNKLHHRDSDIHYAIDVIENLNAPFDLIQACILNLKKLRWPGALLAPLVCDVFSDLRPETKENDIPTCETVEGLPLYGCDGLYTRTGKDCVKQWRIDCSELSGYTLSQLGHALFYTESDILNSEFTSPELDALKKESTQASLLSTGIAINQQSEFLSNVQRNMPHLNMLRAQVLKTEQKQTDLFMWGQS